MSDFRITRRQKYERLTNISNPKAAQEHAEVQVREFAERLYAMAGRPPRRMLVRPSFYNAWCRRWNAHYLSKALGYSSKDPPIR